MEIHPRFPIVFFASLFFVSNVSFALEIAGKIQVTPSFPRQEVVEVKKDANFCGAEKISESLIISKEGFLANAVVSLKGIIPSTMTWGGPAPVLNQKNCNFSPHILLIPPALPFFIRNGDPVAHDVRAFDGTKMVFQFEMNSDGESVEKTFDHPGVYVIRCGLHRWMHAFAVQMEHPYYAVTDTDGKFVLRGMAPGSYQLHIWHETLGETTVPLNVTDSIQDFSYTFPKENA